MVNERGRSTTVPLCPLRESQGCRNRLLAGSFAADPLCGGRGALSDGEQVVVAGNVAVFWQVVGILAEAPAAERALDNAHRGLNFIDVPAGCGRAGDLGVGGVAARRGLHLHVATFRTLWHQSWWVFDSSIGVLRAAQ